MIRVLVTAFGAFPGAPVNPTMAIAAALRKRRNVLRLAGIEVLTGEFPVEYASAGERLAQAIARTKPDAILHLGLAARRRAISVETRARNRLSIVHPDAARRTAGRLRLAPGQAEQRKARFPVHRLRAVLAAVTAARLSNDAGDYLCNQVLYLSLGAHELPCGFIHVPRPRALAWRDSGKIPPPPRQKDLNAAIEACVRVMARHARCAHNIV